ncbi:MAG: hypothetical protein ACXAC5_24210 [Promethearchaeota archaeon]|jgi:hypothetical protein
MIYVNPLARSTKSQFSYIQIGFPTLFRVVHEVVRKFGKIDETLGWDGYPSSLESKSIKIDLNSDLSEIRVISLSGSFVDKTKLTPFTVFLNYYYNMKYNPLIEFNFDRSIDQDDSEFLENHLKLFTEIAINLRDSLRNRMKYLTICIALDITSYGDVFQKRYFHYQQPDVSFAESLIYQFTQASRWLKGKQAKGYIPPFVEEQYDNLSSREYIMIERLFPKLFTRKFKERKESVGQFLLSKMGESQKSFVFTPGSVQIQVRELKDYENGINEIMNTFLNAFKALPKEENLLNDLQARILSLL